MTVKRLFPDVSGCLMVALLFVYSCKKTDAPVNPYNGIDHSTTNTIINPIEPDSNSIVGLHKNIFSQKCANPGCHDGTFEPDYRTIQSTYSTLVYQNVNRITVNHVDTFTYRVVPYDTVKSFLFERITTSTSDYMPSNGTRLSRNEIDHIKTWIMNGARDEFGNIPVKPDLQPNVIGYWAIDQGGVRIDTNRVNGVPYLPFITPANIFITLPILVLDTADGSAATLPANFTSFKIKCSTQKDDFTNSTVISGTYNSGFTVWQVVVNTGLWTSGTTVYFRVYVNDGHHTSDAEFPRNESLDYYKTYYAFYVQ